MLIAQYLLYFHSYITNHCLAGAMEGDRSLVFSAQAVRREDTRHKRTTGPAHDDRPCKLKVITHKTVTEWETREKFYSKDTIFCCI